jgi:hypothetical protein
MWTDEDWAFDLTTTQSRVVQLLVFDALLICVDFIKLLEN